MTRFRTSALVGLLSGLVRCASPDATQPGDGTSTDAGALSDAGSDGARDAVLLDRHDEPIEPPDDDAGCPGPCPVCPEGHACVRESSFGPRVVPICLKTCQSTSECGADEWCIETGGQQGLCIGPPMPATCSPINSGAHCDWPYSGCAGNTARNFVARRGVWCGFKLDACPNGCTVSIEGGVARAQCL